MTDKPVAPESIPTPQADAPRTDWVTCPICGQPDMKKEIDRDGNALISCVNLACWSNGGTYSKCDCAEAVAELRKYLNQVEGETVIGGIRNLAQALIGREEEIEQLNAELARANSDAQPAMPSDRAESLARHFHESYERLAPQFGYETRKESAKPWSDVPEKNRALMTAVCAEMLRLLVRPDEFTYVKRATGRTIPDLTKREHVCEYQSAVGAAPLAIDRTPSMPDATCPKCGWYLQTKEGQYVPAEELEAEIKRLREVLQEITSCAGYYQRTNAAIEQAEAALASPKP